jgi:hypothetical protein
MMIFNVAEWCVEALLLSISFFLTAISLFICIMLITLAWNAWERSDLKQQFDTDKGE